MYRVTVIEYNNPSAVDVNQTQVDTPPAPNSYTITLGTLRGSMADMTTDNQILKATYYYNGGTVIVELDES